MNLIAIETSTENCAVALLHNGQVNECQQIAAQKHAELVLGYLDSLLAIKGLKKTDINGIVFGQGPGAFTGVRIATSIVQGLALALEIPVMAVSTMKNMANQVWMQDTKKEQRILIANDARMGEVYWASFEVKNGSLLRLTRDALGTPAEIKTSGFDVCAGSAFKSMIQTNKEAEVLADMLPDAVTLLDLAETDFSSKAQQINEIKPSYIREKVVFN